MTSAKTNLVMTVIGFVVSTLFIVFICTRLICARIQLRSSRRILRRHIASRSNLSTLEGGMLGVEPPIVANFPTKKYGDEYFSSAERGQNMSDALNIQESRNRAREDEEDIEFVQSVMGFIILVVGAWYGQTYRVKEVSWDEGRRALKRTLWMDDLKNDRICRDQLRLDTRCFEKLCYILQSQGGLKTSRYVTVKEIVAIFLHILAHDMKNRVMQGIFARSGETISRQFHVVLEAVLKLGKYYMKPRCNTNYSRDNKWKFFDGVVGALDGTHIKMTVLHLLILLTF